MTKNENDDIFKIKKGFLLMVIFSLLSSLLGCYKQQKKDENSYINYFLFKNNLNGEFNSCEIKKKHFNKYKLSHHTKNKTVTIHPKTISDLHKIVFDNNIESWNGFSQSNLDYLNSYSFLLMIELHSKQIIYANRKNAFPQYFGDFTSQTQDFFQ